MMQKIICDVNVRNARYCRFLLLPMSVLSLAFSFPLPNVSGAFRVGSLPVLIVIFAVILYSIYEYRMKHVRRWHILSAGGTTFIVFLLLLSAFYIFKLGYAVARSNEYAIAIEAIVLESIVIIAGFVCLMFYLHKVCKVIRVLSDNIKAE